MYQFLLLSHFSFSFATLRNVPGSYATIQAALAACITNDTVTVQIGTYNENIIWPNISGIKLFSLGDSSNTIINGNATGNVFKLLNASIDTNTVIKGFKITNGLSAGGSAASGGGVQIENCSPTFETVSITENHIGATNYGYGAGVYAINSSCIFKNSTIWANVTDTATWGYGGGLYISGIGDPKFINVKIHNNVVKSNS